MKQVCAYYSDRLMQRLEEDTTVKWCGMQQGPTEGAELRRCGAEHIVYFWREEHLEWDKIEDRDNRYRLVSDYDFLALVKARFPKSDKVQAFESGIDTPETVSCRCIPIPNCKFIITPKYPKELLLL